MDGEDVSEDDVEDDGVDEEQPDSLSSPLALLVSISEGTFLSSCDLADRSGQNSSFLFSWSIIDDVMMSSAYSSTCTLGFPLDSMLCRVIFCMCLCTPLIVL